MKLRKGKPEDAGMSPERLNLVRDLAESWVAEGITPSLVILAARRGEIVLDEAYGLMGPEPGSSRISSDTMFPLASVTKLITATAAMILVEDGLLSLNRPVAEYIPEFVGKNKDKVMIHHLLTHTSGLNEVVVREHIEKIRGGVRLPSLTDGNEREIFSYRDLGYDAPLTLELGKEMSYCDFGFVILGEIIGRVSGKALNEFAKEVIFQPLGMKNTHFIPSISAGKQIVRRLKGTPFDEGEEDRRKVPDGSVSVYSTAIDMAIFCQMFLNGGGYGNTRILNPLSAREMTRNQIPGVGSVFFDEVFPEAGWGLGWAIKENKKFIRFGSLPSSDTYWHSGAGGIFLWVDPVYEIVGVYFSVEPETGPDGDYKWKPDLFANAITAAVK